MPSLPSDRWRVSWLPGACMWKATDPDCRVPIGPCACGWFATFAAAINHATDQARTEQEPCS